MRQANLRLPTSTCIGMANLITSASLSRTPQKSCGGCDANYATARLVAHVCRAIDDNTDALSVGLQQPGDNEQAAALLDHGHYVVDMGDGTITQHNRWLPNGGEVIREINIEFYGG